MDESGSFIDTAYQLEGKGKGAPGHLQSTDSL